MSYLGNTPTTQNFISGTDYFNGTGAQTAFTLSRTVASINDIQVTVNNVVQQPNSGYTISGTTLTFDQAPSAGTQNVYVRYLSTTTQAITPSQNTVSWNTLDSNIQQDLGVMYKNRIINGNMVIDQRNAGASVSASGSFPVDRWNSYFTQASKLTMQQNAGSVTPPTGFTNYLGVTSSSAYSITSTDAFVIYQKIEGYNVADLGFGTANAKTVTLSFWVRSSLTGTFGGALVNSAENRSYPFSYSIGATNTWEYKTITIPGDTTGTWLTTNGTGMTVFFSMGSGANLSGTAGAWAAAQDFSATGATSVVGINGATWYITGVQLEVGTQATAFSTAGGSYGAELALCQRYYARITSGTGSNTTKVAFGNGIATSTSNANIFVLAPVTMRAFPTFNYSSVDVTDNTTYDAAVSAIASASYSNNGVRVGLTTANTMTQFRPSTLVANWNSANAGYVEFSAEL